MQNVQLRHHRKPSGLKGKNLEWLVYLPGAIIIGYGLWLTITNF